MNNQSPAPRLTSDDEIKPDLNICLIKDPAPTTNKRYHEIQKTLC